MNLVIFAAQWNRYKASCVLSCFMIAHIFKDIQKVAGDINSLNLLVILDIRANLLHCLMRYQKYRVGIANNVNSDQAAPLHCLIRFVYPSI